jgi:hypothetical protein
MQPLILASSILARYTAPNIVKVREGWDLVVLRMMENKEAAVSRITRGVWSVLIACVFLAVAGGAACALGAREEVSVNDIGDFDQVSLEISGELILTQGDRESLAIEASPSDLSRIVTEVRLRALHIAKNRATQSPVGPVTYRLTMKNIAGLETHSSGSIRAGSIATDTLHIAIQSSGNITIDSLIARSLEVVISSSGECTLSGQVDRQAVRISSSGDYRAGKLASRETKIQVTSSGESTIRVTESLDALISSSGDIRYHGNPPRITSRITSSGHLIHMGD